MLLTPTVPSLGAFVMSGVYDIPAVQTDIVGVFTNKMPTDAIRGAGRPEATHMIEVCVDQLAAELGMDRIELRRKNFMDPASFPHETALGVVYDSGNYPGALDKLFEHFDEGAAKSEAPAGKLRGVGYSTYTEICGLAPSRVTGPSGFGLQTGLWESAMVRVHITGAVTVFTGTSPHGQGLETTLAQVVADRLGTSPENIEVIHGDTGTGPQGLGSVRLALDRGRRRGGGARDGEDRREGAPDRRAPARGGVRGRRAVDGKFSVKGSPDKGMTIGDIVDGGVRHGDVPDDMEPGLEELAFYDPENFVFPFGAHACVVDVDPDTGNVDVVRYVAIDDCGPAINPKLIDGQVHGGIVHAIGKVLFERDALHRGRSARNEQLCGLRAAERRRRAVVRARPHGDPVTGQLARRQGDRRGGHDRRVGRRDERRDRRAAAGRRHLHEHAAQPDAGLGDDSGGER